MQKRIVSLVGCLCLGIGGTALAQPDPVHPANAKDPLRPAVRTSKVRLIDSPDARPTEKAEKAEKPEKAEKAASSKPEKAAITDKPVATNRVIARAKLRVAERSGDKAARAKKLRDRRRERLNKIPRKEAMPPKLRAELAVHALRMAKLERIEAIAAEKGDVNVLVRVARALGREQVRHSGWLVKFADEVKP